MYIPKHFEVKDKEVIYSFIEENAFGQLISNVNGRPFSTHMPFLLSEDKTKILGHMALQNPQHCELNGQEVLITLQGAHDYVSPSWYSSPGVPTWNYQSVHIYGHCTIFTEPSRLKLMVDALTQKYESASAKPWQPDYEAKMLRAIVGVEIVIGEIQCKYKLSQNRSVQDQSQVIAQLENLGSNKLAQAMTRNQS